MSKAEERNARLCALRDELDDYRGFLQNLMARVREEVELALTRYLETKTPIFRIHKREFNMNEFLHVVVRVFKEPRIPYRARLVLYLPEEAVIAVMGDVKTMRDYLRPILGDDLPALPESLARVRIVSRVMVGK